MVKNGEDKGNIKWKMDIRDASTGDDFGGKLSSVFTSSVEQTGIEEPCYTELYKHYCVEFVFDSINLGDCSILLMSWSRLKVDGDYCFPVYIVASTICFESFSPPTPPPGGPGNVGTIGFWDNKNGRPLQKYPVWLGTEGGQYSTVITNVDEASLALKKQPKTIANDVRNIKAQLLAAKFAILNGAYLPPFIGAAILAADSWLAVTDPLHQDKLPALEFADPDDSLEKYYVEPALDMYNNGNGCIKSVSGGSTKCWEQGWPTHY